MNIDLMFKGDHIAAVELAGKKPTLTIVRVEPIEIADEDGKKKTRPLVRFKEIERSWVLNKTNSILMSALWGKDTKDWIGKRVTLAAESVKFGRETVAGIRMVGSPDIDQVVDVEVKLPRKRATTTKLLPTGRQQQQPAQGEQPPVERQAGEEG